MVGQIRWRNKKSLIGWRFQHMIERIAFFMAMLCLRIANFCTSMGMVGRDIFVAIGDWIADGYRLYLMD